jgi:hypothetical protein
MFAGYRYQARSEIARARARWPRAAARKRMFDGIGPIEHCNVGIWRNGAAGRVVRIVASKHCIRIGVPKSIQGLEPTTSRSSAIKIARKICKPRFGRHCLQNEANRDRGKP